MNSVIIEKKAKLFPISNLNTFVSNQKNNNNNHSQINKSNYDSNKKIFKKIIDNPK
jgi:phosphoribosyl-ATP pyrophosphohydrolase